MTADIIPFPGARPPKPVRTYTAKHTTFSSDNGFVFNIAGTLDGWIDFAIRTPDEHNITYQVTPGVAKQIIAGLHATIQDIAKNCLYDRDELLAPPDDDGPRVA